MARVDQQLALYEFFGGVTTFLAAAASAGAAVLSTDGPVAVGSALLVQPSAMALSDTISENIIVQTVSGTGPYTLSLAGPLQNNYAQGSTVAPYKTTQPTVFPFVKTLVNGEPLTVGGNEQPVLFLTSPLAVEKREYAQKKFITYTLSAILTQVIPANSPSDRGPVSLLQFYSWLDQIADKIRTNKQLITSSYPNGAAIKFGENSKIAETHERVENAIWIVAKLDVESVEQVNA